MRLLATLLAGLTLSFCSPASAAPRPEAKPSGPALVGQARSWADLVAMIREGVKTIGGPKLADGFDKTSLPSISPTVFPAIDPNKPFGLYALAEAQPQDCRLVFLIPIRAGDDFLKQLSDFGIKTEKTAGDATFQILSPMPIPVHLKFNDGYACISLGGADALAPKKLLAPKDVLNAKEKSPAVLTVQMDRIPAELKKFVVANALDALEQYQEAVPEGEMREVFKLTSSLGIRWLRQLTEQCQSMTLRLDADPKTADMKLDLAITPIPKTQLAEAIAARQPNTNAFGGLVTKDSVQWVMLSTPMFHEDVREALVKLTVLGQKAAIEQTAQVGTPETLALTEAFFKSLTSTLKSGSMDFAAVLRGPNAKGHYSAVIAIQMLETANLEKAVKAALKTAPEEVSKLIKMDTGKVGELNLHEITIPEAPEALKEFFGPDLTVRVGVHQKAIYFTFGPDSKKILAEVPALKPVSVAGFDNSGNLKATAKLIRRIIPDELKNSEKEEGGMISGILDAMEKNDRLSGMQLSLTGGEKLHLTLNFNAQFGMMGGPSSFMMFAGVSANKTFQQIGPNAAPPAPAPDKAKD